MPLVNVKLIEGVFSPTQKKQMIAKVTDAVVEVGGENIRPVTWVVLEDVKSGDFGVAGEPLTTGAVKDMIAAKV